MAVRSGISSTRRVLRPHLAFVTALTAASWSFTSCSSGSDRSAVASGGHVAPAETRDASASSPDADAGELSPTDGAPPPQAAAPLVAPATGGTGAHLVTVGAPSRLELHGVTVWGIPDFVTTTFGSSQHDHRDAVAATIASWHGNAIRLRVLADEYENPTYVGSQGAYLAFVKDWVTAAEAHGLYVQICWWDSLDSNDSAAPKNDANWATQYSFAFPMMKDVYAALKLADGSDDPAVFYEPFNEPNGVTWAQWTTAMQATLTHFRSTLG